MKKYLDVLSIELLKIRHSRMPLFTAAGFLLIPLACGFVMFIYKDPDFARNAGLISSKASLLGSTADWPTYLTMLHQAVGIVGLMLFSLIQSWVFGREYVEGTIKDMLAVPLPRFTILAAKYLTAGLWSLALVILFILVGMGMGFLIDLPQPPAGLLVDGSITLLITAVLVILAVFPFAFFASIGRGYLLPIGISMLALIAAQIMGVMGWAEYCPWAIPVLYNGPGTVLPYSSLSIVILTAFTGMAATYLWWKYADQCS